MKTAGHGERPNAEDQREATYAEREVVGGPTRHSGTDCVVRSHVTALLKEV